MVVEPFLKEQLPVEHFATGAIPGIQETRKQGEEAGRRGIFALPTAYQPRRRLRGVSGAEKKILDSDYALVLN